jgi:NAD(P)-dependent dehydrogenase (short-subunit alcohol dehydrogenase family)
VVQDQAANEGGFELVALDLASLASVRACADKLAASGKPFDLVIANAGVACPKGVTADGFETQFGTNHLGHFVLVNRIVSLLKPGARLVNLSSAGHRFAGRVSRRSRMFAPGVPRQGRRPDRGRSRYESALAIRS